MAKRLIFTQVGPPEVAIRHPKKRLGPASTLQQRLLHQHRPLQGTRAWQKRGNPTHGRGRGPHTPSRLFSPSGGRRIGAGRVRAAGPGALAARQPKQPSGNTASCLLPKAASSHGDRERAPRAVSTPRFSLSQGPWKPAEERTPLRPSSLPTPFPPRLVPQRPASGGHPHQPAILLH